MRFKEFLAESLSSYEFKWSLQTEKRWNGSFKTKDNHTVAVQIFPFSERNGKVEQYEVMFARAAPNGEASIEATNEGDAGKIFGTVIQMIQEFVEEVKPNVVRFTAFKGEHDPNANSESRTKLYTAICKRFASKFGYILDKTEFNGHDEFILRRAK